ncbi:tudor domain-containing protein 5-like isoform X4 [Periplaneta americana]|uniref:tudor domain-containing protein 5-like isoform X4 n=1 Tax=Periplaneta americana TaxID=6978 RepID=UPI0037E87F6D
MGKKGSVARRKKRHFQGNQFTIKKKEENTIQNSESPVLFVDYGTTSRVKKKDLRFMHQDFGAFPMQAIQASLANLIPAGDGKKWPCAVNKRFLEMVSEKTLIAVVSSVDHETKQGRLCSMKPLVAIVLAVDFKAHKVEVALVDTSGPEDIHINDVLEREGLAQFMTSRQPQPPPPPVQRKWQTRSFT